MNPAVANKDRPKSNHAPGLAAALRFPPLEGSITSYYQSVVRELWDRAFCSGDLPGAAMVSKS